MSLLGLGGNKLFVTLDTVYCDEFTARIRYHYVITFPNGGYEPNTLEDRWTGSVPIQHGDNTLTIQLRIRLAIILNESNLLDSNITAVFI